MLLFLLKDSLTLSGGINLFHFTSRQPEIPDLFTTMNFLPVHVYLPFFGYAAAGTLLRAGKIDEISGPVKSHFAELLVIDYLLAAGFSSAILSMPSRQGFSMELL